MFVGIAGLDANIRYRQASAALRIPAGGNSDRLGDRAAQTAYKRGVWFADFTYLVTPYRAKGNGYVLGDALTWRAGRQEAFSRAKRLLPLFIDSAAYRRVLTGTAPQWAHHGEDVYPAAIELLDPDGYAAFDDPTSRAKTLEALQWLTAAFPQDRHNGRLWPVFSARWTWRDDAPLSFSRLPGWASKNLASFIPLNRTQRQYKESTLDGWARQAIANALLTAADPDLKMMADTFGQVMIGGLVRGPAHRLARHLYAAVLCELYPGVKFWLLGQANYATVNGLGMMGLLDRVYTDGSWWIKDAASEQFAIVEGGLITMIALQTSLRRGERKRKKARETFFTTGELMAANLRSLLSAYEGLWNWPPPEPLPLDLLDAAQKAEMKNRLHAAQLELGL